MKLYRFQYFDILAEESKFVRISAVSSPSPLMMQLGPMIRQIFKTELKFYMGINI